MYKRVALFVFTALTIVLTATGCGDKKSGGSGDTNGGTIVISSSGEADMLFPPLTSNTGGQQVNNQIFEPLAMLKPELNTMSDAGFEPRLSDQWTWGKDSLSIAFHLNPKAKWHDGQPVRAGDVKFTYDLYKDPEVGSPVATLIESIDSVTVQDSITAVFWFHKRSPLQFYDAAYQMSILPEHVYGSVPHANLHSDPITRKPVGSGKYKFASWNAGSEITVVANMDHYLGRPKLDRIVWTISPDFNTAQTRFLAGEADLFEALRPDAMAEVAKNPNLKLETFPSMDYAFMLFNLKKPLFANPEIRKAITMALDRQAMVKNVFDTTAVIPVGPTVRAYASTDTTIPAIPYDTAKAYPILRKGFKGKPISFSLLVPSSSKNRVKMAVLIQDQLRRAGVDVKIEELEFNTMGDRQARRDFDAILGAWHIDASPGGIRQIWGIRGSRMKNGSNYGSYESRTFDAYVDSALATSDPAMTKAYFTKAYTTIVNDAPAVWLYEPRAMLALHKRIHTVDVRPDAWWANMDKWWIPEQDRIARDKVGH